MPANGRRDLIRRLKVNTLLFADDQVIIQDSEDRTPEIWLYIIPNEQRLQPQNIYGQDKNSGF